MQIIFWTVRFSSWNNLSCFFSLFLLMSLFFEHWEILFSHLSAPRTTLSLVYTSRKLRPSPALFTSCPQKPGLSVAPHVFASLFLAQWLEPSLTASLSPHASQSFGIGCSFGFGRSMPSASSSLASFSISYACTYFVHNLYTKTNTATNHVSNLHPRCLYAGNISNIQKMQRPMMMQTRSFPICCRELSYYSPSLYSLSISLFSSFSSPGFPDK